MKKIIIITALLNFLIFSTAYADIFERKPGESDPLSSNLNAVVKMANKLSQQSLSTTQDDTKRCYKGPSWARVHTGKGGEWRQLNGTVKSVELAQERQDGNVTIAIFRVIVSGKSKQKGYKCVRNEHTTRDENFDGDAYIKLKHSNGQIALLEIQVLNDHWGMMKEAMKSLANKLDFILMAH